MRPFTTWLLVGILLALVTATVVQLLRASGM